MKKLILLVITLFTLPTFGQDEKKSSFFDKVYDEFFKYSTVYVAGEIRNSIEAKEPTYFVRTNPDGNLYDVPEIVDNTPDFPYDYRYGFGIRKLARFDYERKPRNYYNGNEDQLVFYAPTSAVIGLEYQFHFEKERFRGELYDNHRYFLKHTGKYHIAKIESREVGRINLEYQSAELRARLPIGKKLSISAGAIYRTHKRAYGYNPIAIWLNEMSMDESGNMYPTNPWFTLGYEYGYTDHFTTYTDAASGEEIQDWIWKNQSGDVVAYSDLDFRERIFNTLINRYNQEQWNLLDPFGEIAPIVGFDFYHYKNKFWLHAYGNYILPYHRYLKGDVTYSYLHRNGWNHSGHHEGHLNTNGDQWTDYSFGASFGWKLGRNLGLFAEGEYTKMWDSQLFQTTFGINYTFK